MILFTLQRYEFFSKSQLCELYQLVWWWYCLPYKGTNFSANHNIWRRLVSFRRDIVYPTKVRIFQQITTGAKSRFYGKRCCLPYKGTNFSANHNEYRTDENGVKDVVYPTKVRIFQQITTTSDFCFIWLQMLFTLQRYEFFSKSQPVLLSATIVKRCCLPYKGTNFSANHNTQIIIT